MGRGLGLLAMGLGLNLECVGQQHTEGIVGSLGLSLECLGQQHTEGMVGSLGLSLECLGLGLEALSLESKSDVHLQLLDSLLDDAPYVVVDQSRSGLFGGHRSSGIKADNACLLEKSYSIRLAKIRICNFHKVVQQHTEGMVGSII